MPIYKGTSEVASGTFKKGTTEIQNGYKETDQFYVNQNSITILFVDSVSGATLNTTQWFETGTPGASFTTQTRVLTANSNRVITSASVSESGDGGNNVSASISSSGGSSRTVTVSGTFPQQSTTVTITVSGTTVQDQPNLIVSVSNSSPNSPSFNISTENGGALGTVSWSFSSNCPGSSNDSGSFTTTSNSRTINPSSYGSYPSCGSSCNNSFSASASGYDSGGNSFTNTGSYPSLTPSCTIQSGFNWSYNFSHNPSRPTSSPDGCSTINLQTNGISNLGGYGVTATDCSGSWPSSWTDNLSATLSFIRCTGATGSTTGLVTCSGGSSGTGTINPTSAGAWLYNA